MQGPWDRNDMTRTYDWAGPIFMILFDFLGTLPENCLIGKEQSRWVFEYAMHI